MLNHESSVQWNSYFKQGFFQTGIVSASEYKYVEFCFITGTGIINCNLEFFAPFCTLYSFLFTLYRLHLHTYIWNLRAYLKFITFFQKKLLICWFVWSISWLAWLLLLRLLNWYEDNITKHGAKCKNYALKYKPNSNWLQLSNR